MSSIVNPLSDNIAILIMMHNSNCHQCKINELAEKHIEIMNCPRHFDSSPLRKIYSPVVGREYAGKDTLKNSRLKKRLTKHDLSALSVDSSLKSQRIPGFMDPMRMSTRSVKIHEELDNPLMRSQRIPDFMDPMRMSIRPSKIHEELDNPLMRSQRIPSFIDLMRMSTRPSKIHDELVNPLMRSQRIPSFMDSMKMSTLFKIHDQPEVVVRRDPSGITVPYSFTEEIVYKEGCSCHFCEYFKKYNNNPLAISKQFISYKGHGFFPKL